ncbi:MAG: hypothetical protein ACOC56_05885 [Atribacterota bacterium]
MLRNTCKSIFIIALFISILFIVHHVKKIQSKEPIIKKIDSHIGKEFNVSNNIKRFTSNGYMPFDSEKIQNSFKLVYEMNFDCLMCLEEMKEIYDFYLTLSSIREIAFCLITKEKSYSYIKFYIDKSLENYDILVIQQEFTNDNIKLYLLDNLNNIVMAGNIIKYQFLKNEYKKKLEMVDKKEQGDVPQRDTSIASK